MKLDPERGAEDLETFGLFCMAIGSVFYCIIDGSIISRPEAYVGDGHPEPLIYFYFCAFIAILIFIAGFFYP